MKRYFVLALLLLALLSLGCNGPSSTPTVKESLKADFSSATSSLSHDLSS